MGNDHAAALCVCLLCRFVAPYSKVYFSAGLEMQPASIDFSDRGTVQ